MIMYLIGVIATTGLLFLAGNERDKILENYAKREVTIEGNIRTTTYIFTDEEAYKMSNNYDVLCTAAFWLSMFSIVCLMLSLFGIML